MHLVALVILTILFIVFFEKIMGVFLLVFALFNMALAGVILLAVMLLSLVAIFYLLKFLFSSSGGKSRPQQQKMLSDSEGLQQEIETLKAHLTKEKQRVKELEKLVILQRAKLKKLEK
jgi:cell division protein FtsB